MKPLVSLSKVTACRALRERVRKLEIILPCLAAFPLFPYFSHPLDTLAFGGEEEEIREVLIEKNVKVSLGAVRRNAISCLVFLFPSSFSLFFPLFPSSLLPCFYSSLPLYSVYLPPFFSLLSTTNIPLANLTVYLNSN